MHRRPLTELVEKKTLAALKTDMEDVNLVARTLDLHQRITSTTLVGNTPATMHVVEGAPQGGPLGPTFFNSGYHAMEIEADRARNSRQLEEMIVEYVHPISGLLHAVALHENTVVDDHIELHAIPQDIF